MRQFEVTKSEEGLSLVKLSRKLFPQAPGSLIFKFIRNKNIELNGRKASPDTVLKAGDTLNFFLSEETYGKFSGAGADLSGRIRNGEESRRGDIRNGGSRGGDSRRGGRESSRELKRPERPDVLKSIIYEDENILLINKKAGLLSQGAGEGEVSLNDLVLKYLNYRPGDIIKPSVCNRLDKNTSGLIAVGKSAAGLAGLNKGFSERWFEKTYELLCCGAKAPEGEYRAYLKKDRTENKALISDVAKDGWSEIRTFFSPVKTVELGELPLKGSFDINKDIKIFLLKAALITGKTHQIRAHLNFLNCPILGDRKYFNSLSREVSERLGISRQLLHSFSLKFHFPGGGALSYLEGREFTAPLPEDFYGI